jgi:hypothetical protein
MEKYLFGTKIYLIWPGGLGGRAKALKTFADPVQLLRFLDPLDQTFYLRYCGKV